MAKTFYYASVGPALTRYDIDADAGTLERRETITLPATIQYSWLHPSRRSFYVVSSNGGPGMAGDRHFASAFTVDPATGSLRPHGEPASLPSRPIHVSVDGSGGFLLTAYNNPSNITVHRLKSDGSIGEIVGQPSDLDFGIFAHQVMALPGNHTVALVTRGNHPANGKPEDPGAIKIFDFAGGVLQNRASVAPGNGLGFGPRHLDIHPEKPWLFVSIERQNKLYVYRLDSDGGVSKEPLFVRETLLNPAAGEHQGAGAIHLHPNGRFVYLTNRTFPVSEGGGRMVETRGEDSIVTFAVDPASGEPSRLENIDGRGVQLRTFGIDPEGKMLVAASIMPSPSERSGRPAEAAGFTVFKIGPDGMLALIRKYDVEVGSHQLFWSGMVTL
jgi:6-phosphogluconolactonase (cycloisomerase 2 family)